MPSGEVFTTTVTRALVALGGEATTLEILRWVQDNRPHLKPYWQRAVTEALSEHSDGRGKALFERVSEDPARWRLGDIPTWLKRHIQDKRARPYGKRRAQPVGRLVRLVERGLTAPSTVAGDPLEQYLFGLLGYELGRFTEAIGFLDRAIEGGLPDERLAQARRVRNACMLKAGGSS